MGNVISDARGVINDALTTTLAYLWPPVSLEVSPGDAHAHDAGSHDTKQRNVDVSPAQEVLNQRLLKAVTYRNVTEVINALDDGADPCFDGNICFRSTTSSAITLILMQYC